MIACALRQAHAFAKSSTLISLTVTLSHTALAAVTKSDTSTDPVASHTIMAGTVPDPASWLQGPGSAKLRAQSLGQCQRDAIPLVPPEDLPNLLQASFEELRGFDHRGFRPCVSTVREKHNAQWTLICSHRVSRLEACQSVLAA